MASSKPQVETKVWKLIIWVNLSFHSRKYSNCFLQSKLCHQTKLVHGLSAHVVFSMTDCLAHGCPQGTLLSQHAQSTTGTSGKPAKIASLVSVRAYPRRFKPFHSCWMTTLLFKSEKNTGVPIFNSSIHRFVRSTPISEFISTHTMPLWCLCFMFYVSLSHCVSFSIFAIMDGLCFLWSDGLTTGYNMYNMYNANMTNM